MLAIILHYDDYITFWLQTCCTWYSEKQITVEIIQSKFVIKLFLILKEIIHPQCSYKILQKSQYETSKLFKSGVKHRNNHPEVFCERARMLESLAL